MQLKTVRIVLYGAIAAILIVGVALFAGIGQKSQLGTLIPPSNAIGGPFTLTDVNGKTVTDKDLLGKPALMFFGYTFCPDVCPTTLAEAGEWLQALGPNADKLRMVFVTVDPQRDTQEKMKEYLSAFDPRIIGLSGSPESIAAMLKVYRVYARKVPQKDSADYLMDHSAAVYLMDAKGRFVGAINYQEPTDKAIAKLKDLVATGAS
jgi:protein SCO1/2